MRTATTPPLWFTVDTPLPTGPMRVAVTDLGVAATAFTVPPDAPPDDLPATDRRAAAVRTRFAEYFAGHRRDLDLPVDWSPTTGPQRAVLQTLHRTVPYGTTITYGELATASAAFTDLPDQHTAARLTGAILASSPCSIVVPTHRVTAATTLGGFGTAPEAAAAKRWLLTLEGALPPHPRLAPRLTTRQRQGGSPCPGNPHRRAGQTQMRSPLSDSNRRPSLYKSGALPTELRRRGTCPQRATAGPSAF